MEDKITLAHGSGGKLMHELIEKDILRYLNNPILSKLDDSATLNICGKLAFTTDSYVVQPIFFPGGDIGRLAVCGTVNDLAMTGAKPLYLSLSLILEEGFPLADLHRILKSFEQAARYEAVVSVVTGDTKVVNRGCADHLFINTSGIGEIPEDVDIAGKNARPGDKVILSGSLGDHGIAIISQREGFKFSTPVQSDCAPLNHLVAAMLRVSKNIHALRDPTRGGLATSLNELARQSYSSIRIEEDKIPVKQEVQAACEMLGFDPLYVANEGKLICIVAPSDAQKVLEAMHSHKYGVEAAIIGEVEAGNPGQVFMRTCLGSTRIVDMLSGDLLPRIC